MSKFDTLRAENKLIYEYIRGSVAYGTNIETSDIDTGGVFVCDTNDVLGLGNKYIDMVHDARSDNVWYELNKYMHLLCVANPNMLESLFVPKRCILYESPLFAPIKENRQMFITKNCFNSFFGYATSQIEKARGLNKKIVNPVTERKDILDFCYTFKGQGTQPFKNFLEERGLKAKYCGIVHLPNMEQMYGVYYDWGNHFLHEDIKDYNRFHSNRALYNYANELFYFSGDYEYSEVNAFLKTTPICYRGAMDENNDTTQLRLSSVEKGAEPICYISFNENGFKTHCRQYKEYQDWVTKRNPQRYIENKEKEFDRKNMAHCVRLLHMGIEIANTGEFNVDRTDIDRDFILDIRLGNRTYDEIIEYVSEKKEEMRIAMANSTIPDDVDKNVVNDIMIDIRKKF